MFDILFLSVAFIIGGLVLTYSIELIVLLLRTKQRRLNAQLMQLQVEIKERWTSTGATVHLRPIVARFDDDLTTVNTAESALGVIGVVDDRLEFYDRDGSTRFMIEGAQLRAYGLVNLDYRGKHFAFELFSETGYDWQAYRLHFRSLERWDSLADALEAISDLAPNFEGGMGPVNTVGYRQDQPDHWQQTQLNKLYLITDHLLLNWQDSIELDDIREISVLPSPGINPLNAAMLCLKTGPSGEELETIGFDMLFGEAHTWADELHQRTKAPLSIVEALQEDV